MVFVCWSMIRVVLSAYENFGYTFVLRAITKLWTFGITKENNGLIPNKTTKIKM